MYKFLKKKYLKYYAAMKAGWIAAGCNDCEIDDEAEEIRSCPVHKEELTRLERINMQNQ